MSAEVQGSADIAAHKLPIKCKFLISENVDDYVMQGKTLSADDIANVDEGQAPPKTKINIVAGGDRIEK